MSDMSFPSPYTSENVVDARDLEEALERGEISYVEYAMHVRARANASQGKAMGKYPSRAQPGYEDLARRLNDLDLGFNDPLAGLEINRHKPSAAPNVALPTRQGTGNAARHLADSVRLDMEDRRRTNVQMPPQERADRAMEAAEILEGLARREGADEYTRQSRASRGGGGRSTVQ